MIKPQIFLWKAISWLFLVFVISSTASLFGQNNKQEKSFNKECLSINFPRVPTKFDTLNLSLYKAEYNGSEYEVLFSRVNIKVENLRQFKLVLSGYVQGYTKSKYLSNYRIIVSDSTFGGVNGKYIKSEKIDSGIGFLYISNFVTYLNGHIYSIGIRSNCNNSSCGATVSNFYKSIKFDHACKNAKLEDEKLYNASFKFGQRFGIPILIILLTCVSLIGYKFYKNRK